MLRIRIPMMPVSVNAQYSPSKNGFGKKRLTEEAKVYREYLQTIAKQEARKQGWKCVENGFVEVIAMYVMPIGCRQDVNNDKLTWDALEGIAYKNDNQIIHQENIKSFGTNYKETILIIKTITKENYEQITQSILQMATENAEREGGEISGKNQ